MNLAMTIFSMIAAWMAVAIAMLWGVLRIARRHQPNAQASTFPKAASQKYRTELKPLALTHASK